jgi:ATP synthase protein I
MPSNPDHPSPRKDSGNAIRQMAIAFELPFLLVGPVVVGGLIGYFLDNWLHTKPLMLIVLGILGVAVGVFDAVKIAGAEDKKR